METSAAKPHRGMTTVASRFNGWWKNATGKRAFRYATDAGGYRVPKGTHAVVGNIPAIEMAGYPCQMPMASAAQNLRNLNSLICETMKTTMFALSVFLTFAPVTCGDAEFNVPVRPDTVTVRVAVDMTWQNPSIFARSRTPRPQ